MSINTMDEFAALEVGETVRILNANQDWKKVDAGWWSRTDLDTEHRVREIHFVGMVNSGQVAKLTDLPPTLGQIYRGDTNYIVITKPHETRQGEWWGRRFSLNTMAFRGEERRFTQSWLQGRLMDPQPEFARALWSLIQAYDALQQEIKDQRKAMTELDTRVMNLQRQMHHSTNLRAALKTFMEANPEPEIQAF